MRRRRPTGGNNRNNQTWKGVPHPVFNLCSILNLKCPNNQTIEINQSYNRFSIDEF